MEEMEKDVAIRKTQTGVKPFLNQYLLARSLHLLCVKQHLKARNRRNYNDGAVSVILVLPMKVKVVSVTNKVAEHQLEKGISG